MKDPQTIRTRRASRTPAIRRDDWERSWQRHWSQIGLPGYELPAAGRGGAEREFLATTRTRQRKRRASSASTTSSRAFQSLYPVGPAVTVFGSARLQEDHRCYRLVLTALAFALFVGSLAAQSTLQMCHE